MAKLVRVPLGYSARELFVRKLAELPFGEGVLVLPNRLLMDEVKRTSHVETMGLDTVANKLLNINGYVDFKEISRRSQELIVQDIITYMVGNKNLQQLDADKPLSYFGTLADKQGFIKAMTSLVGQLSRSGATEQQIVSALNNWGRQGALGQKDEGVRNLYLLYRQYLKNNKWFDLEGKYRLALRVLEKKDVKLIWKKLYFCDFYSFDKLQIEFIKRLAQHCEVTVGMTYEPVEASGQERDKIFEASKATYQDFLASFSLYDDNSALAKENTRAIFHEQLMPKEELEQTELSEDMAQLRNLGSSCAPVAAQHIHTFEFTSREKEMRWVLASVKRRISQGTAPEEILVAVRDLNTYSGLRLLADEYGIPVSLPQTTTLAVQPLAELVRLLLEAVSDTHEGAMAYFRLLTSELLPVLVDADIKAMDDLRQESYFKTRQEAQQKVAEKLAADDFIAKLDAFIAATKKYDSVAGYCAQLEAFIRSLPLEQRLGSLYKEGRLDLKALAACLQARDAYLKMLEELREDYVRCARVDEKISFSDWQELLAEAAKGVQLVLAHGRADGVLITSVINVQGLNFAYVYLMGVREGEFPKVDNENWIYNDKERSELTSRGVELPNTALAYAEDAFFFATTVAAAQKELYLSWFEEENVGASVYIDAVQKLFNNVKAEPAPLQAAASSAELGRLGKACDALWLKEYLGEELLCAAAADDRRKEEPGGAYNGVLKDAQFAQKVRKAVGTTFSASMLEVYAQCPFRYLGEYIWHEQLFAEKEDAVQPADEGSLLHAVLARFVGERLQEKITQQPLNDLADDLELTFADVCEEFIRDGKIVSSSLWQAEQPRLLRLLQNWLRFEYADQKRWQGFTPAAVEWDFSSKNGKPLYLKLSDRSEVSLVGRLDRIDSDGERVFVTDYKRSSAPSGSDLLKGFDLQLPVYLLAVAARFAGGKKVCGGTYFVLKNSARAAKLVLEDVGNSDLAVKKKQPEELSCWESFASFCQKLLRSYIEAIYAGNFAVQPKRCDKYCQLAGICRLQEITVAEGGEGDE